MTEFIWNDELLDTYSFGDGHPTQVRRAQNTLDWLRRTHVPLTEVEMTREATDEELLVVHTPAYIAEIAAGVSEQWEGKNEAMNRASRQIVAGTIDAARRIMSGETTRAFSPMGAKHHAHASFASGFCVFNDMAIAAKLLAADGHRVAYLDWDAHHGDGVEALTYHERNILTASIHEFGIFPGTGADHNTYKLALNWPLTDGDGDEHLLRSVRDATDMIRLFRPDIVLLAMGADGHAQDPLSSLRYTEDGLAQAAANVSLMANDICGGRILAGGAGGYCPDDYTPLSWTSMFRELAEGEPARVVVQSTTSGV